MPGLGAARSPEGALPAILVPEDWNYIGVFLTLSCNLRCSYCLNRFGGPPRPRKRLLSGEEWLRGLNRLVSRPDLPLSLQGGEPTLHPDFPAIVDGIRADLRLDLLTNLEVDLSRFMEAVPPERMKRDAPYASIRVSFHPESMEIAALAAKVLALQRAGYSVGVWAVRHPRWEEEVTRAREHCMGLGIDFRTKEFLGVHDGRLWGRYRHRGACEGGASRQVRCQTTELLIDPGGDVFRCHSDLYAGRDPVGNILDPAFAVDPGFRPCGNYGRCNPCDVKVKTDRFQQDGHTSVRIEF